MDNKKLRIKETFDQALKNQQKNNLQVAEELYKEVLKSNPDHVEAHNNLGVILLRLGKFQEAKKCFEKVIEINPIYSKAYNGLGNSFNVLGEYKEAIKCYQKAIEINPNFSSAHNNLGNTFNRMEDYQKAKSCYLKAIEFNPNQSDAHSNLGTALQALGELQEAKKCYEKAIKINPNYAIAHNNLGSAFKILGELQEAKKCYEKAIKINPKYADAYKNIGEIFKLFGELKKAIKSYQKAIEINPNHAEAYNNLGNAFSEMEDYQRAKTFYQKAIEINPNHADAYNNLGSIFRGSKEFQRAADYFIRSATVFGNAQFLECTYLSNGIENYNKLLSTFAKKDPKNLRIAALASYVSTKENIKNIYPFCKKPLNYFFSKNLKNEFKSADLFTEGILKIPGKLESNWQLKTIVKNGYQSTGNLFDKTYSEIAELKEKIEKQIRIYKKNYKNSDDYFITRWPNESKLTGWYIKLKKQGQLTSHIHETGWLSGVFYLKVPIPLEMNEGSINLSLQGFDYPNVKNLPNLFYAPKPFDLILYPSSLFHYTVPFSSNEERHCIAFDLTPNKI